jgi:hypothetical protein
VDIKLNRNAPHGKVVGRLADAPTIKFYQNGKYFDAAGNFVQYPPVKEPEPEVVAEIKEPEVKPAVKVKKESKLPPGLPTKE